MVSAHILAKYIQEVTHKVSQFEKNMRLAFLLDFYAEVLDEHTRNIMKAYYHDDLSLSEIAEDESISRQGVRHIIKKGEEALEFYESTLALAQKNEALTKAVDSLTQLKRSLSELDGFKKETEMLDNAISTIKNKGL